MTTVATWHTRTADFLDRLRTTCHRQGYKRVAKRFWDCVNAERQHSNTCCNSYCSLLIPKTFYYSDRNNVCLKDLRFLFIRQHKLWNDAQLKTATVTRFSWYFAANTTVF